MGYPTWEPWKSAEKRVKIHPTAIISPNASVRFCGETDSGYVNLEIGEESHIFSLFNILQPKARITVGKRCQLGTVNFTCTDEIIIGDDILMAWGITILDSDHHSIDWKYRQNDVRLSREDYLKGLPLGVSQDWSYVKKKPVRIGNKCWIGFNASILKGVTLQEGVIVAANSVVTKDVEAWHIVAGNPAKIIGKTPVY
jgi:galactoside O-acetyltransferase